MLCAELGMVVNSQPEHSMIQSSLRSPGCTGTGAGLTESCSVTCKLRGRPRCRVVFGANSIVCVLGKGTWGFPSPLTCSDANRDVKP